MCACVCVRVCMYQKGEGKKKCKVYLHPSIIATNANIRKGSSLPPN